jgi:hypothetical protein
MSPQQHCFHQAVPLPASLRRANTCFLSHRPLPLFPHPTSLESRPRLLSGDKAGVLRCWDGDDFHPIFAVPAHPNGVSCLYTFRDPNGLGVVAVSGGYDAR